MKLYRYSPIENRDQLLAAVRYLHEACNRLCELSLSRQLPNAGNVGIFCHYEDEYENLVKLRKKMAEPSDDPDRKYFRLHEPIVISAENQKTETVYTHIYIRRPDIYRSQVGDVDFYLEKSEYSALKQSLKDRRKIRGARIFPRNDLDMIELYDPDIDALAYVSTATVAEKVRIKLSEETKL